MFRATPTFMRFLLSGCAGLSGRSNAPASRAAGWRNYVAARKWEESPESLVPSASEASHPRGNFGKWKVRRPVSRVLSPPRSGRWPFLWDVRCRTPHATDPGDDAETPLPVTRRAAPIWSCSRWGLPCRSRYRSRGGLLPHRFTLAGPASWAGGLFSVALSLGSPPPAVSRHRVSMEPGLSSPSRLPAKAQPSGRLT